MARRAELVDGTLAAIRRHGSTIGMDEIAADIGVSKTVLYRYFADKADLIRTTMDRYVESTLAPRIYAAIGGSDGEYELIRSAITAYVDTVSADPDVYLFVMGTGGADRDVVTAFQQMFAEVVAAALLARLTEHRIEPGGAWPWSYAIVGAVQLSTHWWISNRSIGPEELINYLTMMVWNAVEGIARDDGSAERFAARAHQLRTPQ
nr:TetR/AcrR family transcriptional regulator [Skermania piniformis]